MPPSKADHCRALWLAFRTAWWAAQDLPDPDAAQAELDVLFMRALGADPTRAFA